MNKATTSLVTLLAVSAGTLIGCQSTPRATGESTAMSASMLDAIKSLEGEWTVTGEDGTTATIVFEVTAANSAVRETMFPGEAHEMTNMYHFDGDSVVVTHYCAAGNQPRMRSTASSTPHDIDFAFDSVTNYKKGQHYMGGLRLVLVDENTLEEHWTSFDGGDHPPTTVFRMTRVR